MYGTLAGWRAYAAARGQAAEVPADDPTATAALVRASDYIQYNYVAMFVAGPDSTKPEVEPATYEAARLEATTPGFFTKTYTPAEQKVLTGVDSIRWSIVGTSTGRGAGSDAAPVSTKIEAMLRPYMPGRYSFGLQSVGGGYV